MRVTKLVVYAKAKDGTWHRAQGGSAGEAQTPCGLLPVSVFSADPSRYEQPLRPRYCATCAN